MEQMWTGLELPWLDGLPPRLERLVRVAFLLAGSLVATLLVRLLIRALRRYAIRVRESRGGVTDVELEKQVRTVAAVIRKAIVALIWTVAFVMAVRELGFDITPLIAGAGVIGVALGLGAQHLVRDVLSGFFLLAENQIRVHDMVVINGTAGEVEEINLRTTVLRSMDGAVHVFNNGAITGLANRSRLYSYYVLELAVPWRQDTDRVVEALRQVVAQARGEDPPGEWIIEPLEVLGVENIAGARVVVKARLKTQPGKQGEVGRELNRRLKKKFEETGIELASPGREEMKGLIREVLEEAGVIGDGRPPRREDLKVP